MRGCAGRLRRFGDLPGVAALCQKTRDRHHGGHRLRQALRELLRVSVCVFDRVTLPQCAFAETVCAGEHAEGVEWGESELAQEFDLVARGALSKRNTAPSASTDAARVWANPSINAAWCGFRSPRSVSRAREYRRGSGWPVPVWAGAGARRRCPQHRHRGLRRYRL